MRIFAQAVAFLLVVAVLYVVSYLVMLTPEEDTIGLSSWGLRNLYVVRTPSYRSGGDVSAWFFDPVHRLDQLVRPTYWYDKLPHTK